MQNVLKYYYFFNNINKVEEFGNGHINRTFLVTMKNSKEKYIVQQINTNVFKKPEEVMQNIELITNHIRSVASKDYGESDRVALEIVPTSEKKTFVKWDNTYWRCYKYIVGARTYEVIETPEMFYEVGLAIGQFQRYLDDFPIDKLHITIPNFHNTPVRYKKLKKVAGEDKHHRGLESFNEVKFVYDRVNCVSNITDLMDKKLIPTRVTHNDTKLNNVMIDEETKKAICVIDLDTVMPGSALYDFGDAIRVGASTAAEDEVDLSKVKIDLELFQMFTQGFLEKTYDILNDYEIDNLVEGARIITLECGIRFLTDFLEKDTYFNTKYPLHNLDRTRAQFKLVTEIEKKYDLLQAIVKKIMKSLRK